MALIPRDRIKIKLKLSHLLLMMLLVVGILPLAISSFLLIWQNREVLETQERTYLTRSAGSLSVELNNYLESSFRQLQQLGTSLLAVPQPERLESRLGQPWVASYLSDFMVANSNLLALRVLDPNGVGPRLGPSDLAPSAVTALDHAFDERKGKAKPAFRFTVLPRVNEPVAVLVIPVVEGTTAGRPVLYIEALARLQLMEAVFRQESRGEVSAFLIDRSGGVLWSENASQDLRLAVKRSDLVHDFTRYPLSLTAEYPFSINGKTRWMIGTVSPVTVAGWGVVVLKPSQSAFPVVRKMVVNTLLSTLLLVLLALVLAAVAARHISRPIQRLAETTHAIAAGDFDQRVETSGLGVELTELAQDFNRMGSYLARYIGRLQVAAQANRELFIGSIRAFAAAIDAKDPYTRGHSERVALMSRAIAAQLGRSEEFQHRVWLAALLHDVGKIGIEDRILKKGGVLSDAEYEKVKAHPVIGEEILRSIDSLQDVLPAIRGHHEAWNGKGYPDGLRGEQIPLMARVVAVADTFDAITTSRPYQGAHAAQFAVDTITKLTGSRFDAKVVTAFLRSYEAGEIHLASIGGDWQVSPPAARA